MNPQLILYRGLIGLALSIGLILGAAGIALIDHFTARRRRLAVEHEVNRLNSDVSELRYQVQQLRSGSKRTKPTTRNTQSVSSETENTDTDRVSAFDTAEEDEEFFDLSDSEYETEDSQLRKLLREVDVLLRGNAEQQQTAFYLLEQHYNKYPDCDELLWRFAEASHALVAALGDTITPENKKAIIQKGCEHAEKAVKLNPQSHEAHKWYAINVGTRGQLSGISDKISDGCLFRKHIEEALKLKPDDSTLHHLMGRFNFEVATLSWVERSLASTFLGMPSASVDEALQHFLKADKLTKTPWKENRLFIARCYEYNGDMKATIDWLEKAAVVESITAGDEAAEKELKELLSKYESLHRNKQKNK